MSEELAEAFDRERPRLTALAARVLGSGLEAEDAVQEAWLRLSRTEADEVRNLPAWLTTVVARVALDQLRSRTTHHVVLDWPEQADEGVPDPEAEAIRADAVGVALMMVIDSLSPSERLAFVLHDVFGVPFADVGASIGRSSDAAKMAASRARRKVRDAEPRPVDPGGRVVLDAFLAAARDGDLDRLVTLLDPDAVAVADTDALRPGTPLTTSGAEAVARRVIEFRPLARLGRPVVVNERPAVLVLPASGRPAALITLDVAHGRILRLDITVDAARLARLDLSGLSLGRP